MKEHYYKVSWDTETRNSLGRSVWRHYSHQFETEAEAVAFARRKRDKGADVRIREAESEDDGITLRVHIIRWNIEF